MEYTSPAFASAMGNLIPSFTFVLALLCRYDLHNSLHSYIFKILLGGPSKITAYKLLLKLVTSVDVKQFILFLITISTFLFASISKF